MCSKAPRQMVVLEDLVQSTLAHKTIRTMTRSHVLLALLSTILLIRRRGATHIPKSALVGGEGSVVPHVNQDTK
jgi:hypothetical protein